LSGGVALNCSSNGVLRRHLAEDVQFFAASGDSGTSIGAAAIATRLSGCETTPPVGNPYLGPQWTDAEIKEIITGLGLSTQQHEEPDVLAADLIADGKVIGWFQGASEAGPRALGHRSILANAFDDSICDRVNRIKLREPWRPVAPSVLTTSMAGNFEGGDSPYMLEARRASSRARNRFPSVIHVDGTSRVQTPSKYTHPRFVRLLSRISSLLGDGIIVNTSFNVGTEPMASSPIDAVRTFYGSSLDALVIGSTIISK
jgi:carbamoyltransferase